MIVRADWVSLLDIDNVRIWVPTVKGKVIGRGVGKERCVENWGKQQKPRHEASHKMIQNA